MHTIPKEPNNRSLDIIEFNSQLLEQDQIFDFWSESIKPLFLCEKKEDHKLEHIHHKSAKIDQIVLAKGGFSSQFFVRDRKHLLRHDDSDHILVQWYAQGGCHVDNGGRNYIQSPQHIVMMDLGYESFSSTILPFSEIITLIIPRELLQECWGSIDNLAGLSLPVDSTRGVLLKNFMLSLSEELDGIKVSDASTIAQVTVQMVCSMFKNEVKQTNVAPDIFEVELKLLIKNFIVTNLCNPQLSADMLIERFHCSRATLYRLFQTYGGVARYIDFLRLKRCYRYLVSNPVKRGEITKIAQYWGFRNRQQFTRQFRQHFGVNPSDVVMGGADNFPQRYSYQSHKNIAPNSYRLASWFTELGCATKS
ncbi:helix-turn-helix domain-containing protein [Nodularia sp. UHCC 0506]|uniref:helix-turn-helix domain-containing protein n=1 Tax=Nodularia sp. UHCC 0506 TaxID=3110243 RepID=UPI002B211E0B|nr:helix-turn-helix domain-containing protein [Nodularia sp. UHCC 0506]MEA5514138.1 helix-turn-helix domain-containing protein [Nodularia sp. UHCC 0506]